MQSERSGRRRNDEFIGGSKLIFLIIFATSCYVLNEIEMLSKNSMPGRSETIVGRKSSQEIEIDSETIGKSSEIEKIRKSRKTAQKLRK